MHHQGWSVEVRYSRSPDAYAPFLLPLAERARVQAEIGDDPYVTLTEAVIADRIWYGRAVDTKQGLTEYVSPDIKDARAVSNAQAEFMELFKELFA